MRIFRTLKRFAQLYQELDESNRTNDKVLALVRYFSEVNAADATWAIALLTGRRPKKPVTTTQLQNWAMEAAGIPAWLFAESYGAVGDLSETISLLTQQQNEQVNRSLSEWMQVLHDTARKPEEEKKSDIISFWKSTDDASRFLLNKLMGGSFRVGVSRSLVVRALAKATGLDENVMAHRLMGNWEPGPDAARMLFAAQSGNDDNSKPYPFFLASALDAELHELGETNAWSAEWKWDGIRAQLIKRKGELFIWTRGEELVSDRYPELLQAMQFLPDGIVLDGELLAYKNNKPQPFALLQKRIGRKSAGKKIMADVPVAVFCYDLIEYNGNDIRQEPLLNRRKLLEEIIGQSNHPLLQLSPLLSFDSWEHLAELRSHSREQEAEGLMLKHKNSVYQTGRKRGEWWKWKTDPFTADAVLVYAQRGTGRRANLYTDYTFALRNTDGTLVPFAKAYSGLTDEEIKEVDAFVRANTIEKFGPVRTVKAELVFELAFEGIQLSPRHKSGIAVRFPRISRWRKDKKMEEADLLEDIKKLISQQ